jgi:hypothetical protein
MDEEDLNQEYSEDNGLDDEDPWLDDKQEESKDSLRGK